MTRGPRKHFVSTSIALALCVIVAGYLGGCADPPPTRAELDAMSALQSVRGHVREDPKGSGHAYNVDMKGSLVTDATLAPVANLPFLYELVLDGTPVTDAGLAHLEGLQNLKKLSLRRTGVTDAGLAHLQKLSSLDELDIENLPITDAGLAELGPIKSLRKVYVSAKGVTSPGVDALKAQNPAVNVSRK